MQRIRDYKFLTLLTILLGYFIVGSLVDAQVFSTFVFLGIMLAAVWATERRSERLTGWFVFTLPIVVLSFLSIYLDPDPIALTYTYHSILHGFFDGFFHNVDNQSDGHYDSKRKADLQGETDAKCDRKAEADVREVTPNSILDNIADILEFMDELLAHPQKTDKFQDVHISCTTCIL